VFEDWRNVANQTTKQYFSKKQKQLFRQINESKKSNQHQRAPSEILEIEEELLLN